MYCLFCHKETAGNNGVCPECTVEQGVPIRSCTKCKELEATIGQQLIDYHDLKAKVAEFEKDAVRHKHEVAVLLTEHLKFDVCRECEVENAKACPKCAGLEEDREHYRRVHTEEVERRALALGELARLKAEVAWLVRLMGAQSIGYQAARHELKRLLEGE